jgi:hypothetical protein
MKLTPWFPANVKPVRVGVYEVQMDGPPVVSLLGWCALARRALHFRACLRTATPAN